MDQKTIYSSYIFADLELVKDYASDAYDCAMEGMPPSEVRKYVSYMLSRLETVRDQLRDI